MNINRKFYQNKKKILIILITFFSILAIGIYLWNDYNYSNNEENEKLKQNNTNLEKK
ncbi:hypothetical protein LFWB_0070 [Candidatus Phytoplasma luffae]|uniref:Uncharacterized protein n=1 Tax=Loofah witches'-broom phytoplasma TaxID=35773 RepID=A0A975FIT8_LOWBP|nr:hypothetical protein [Candidatus Phytoplasma luffae]QTX02577.1 hypothetical protein LFWB_0070 [Candidatus Phytoplasma luffae]